MTIRAKLVLLVLSIFAVCSTTILSAVVAFARCCGGGD